MPQSDDPSVDPKQRDLADSIILMLPLDEIRILLACGAKVIVVNRKIYMG